MVRSPIDLGPPRETRDHDRDHHKDQHIDHIEKFLRDALLFDGEKELLITPLSGGVSSDIWYVSTGGREICVKAALPQLRTREPWYAPVSRNQTEVRWFQYVQQISPQAVPDILAHDPDLGLFAMTYLPPDQFPVWKSDLAGGHVDVSFAEQTGDALGVIHAQTADDPSIRTMFETSAEFDALRIDPYLRHLLTRHPQLASAVKARIDDLNQHRVALVHGDVSPKNILKGPKGPIFLDAETATHGDPVFDLSFCLNHLLLKMIWVPSAVHLLAQSYRQFTNAYFQHVAWEDPAHMHGRAARLLLLLLLARIDGKSPVEYITDDAVKQRMRDILVPAIMAEGVTHLDDVLRLWQDGMCGVWHED